MRLFTNKCNLGLVTRGNNLTTKSFLTDYNVNKILPYVPTSGQYKLATTIGDTHPLSIFSKSLKTIDDIA